MKAQMKTMEVMAAGGAYEKLYKRRAMPLFVGAARMGNDPRTSVVDKFGRTHDIANLFIVMAASCPHKDQQAQV